jgi:hypothetical protein
MHVSELCYQVDILISFRRRAMTRSFVGHVDVRPTGGGLKLDELTINTSGNYTRISALLQNIAYLTQSIQQLQVASISYINFAGLVSIGALTIGIIQPVPLVEIFAPYGLSIVYIFLIQLYTDIERLTTIREVFEQQANSEMPRPAFLGLNKMSSDYRGRKSVRLIAVLLAIPLGLFGYHSVRVTMVLTSSAKKSEHVWQKLFPYLNYVGLGFCFIVIAWASCELFRAHRNAVREVAKTLEGPRSSANPRV